MKKTNRVFLLSCTATAILLCAVLSAQLLQSPGERAADERLSFQTNGPWSPRTNLNADVAMVYGIGPRMPANIETWKQHGYIVQSMTGVAWGQYQDYLNGQFDGAKHWDEAQTSGDGKLVLHGGNPNVPYISPGENYGKYLTLGVKRALDAGAQAIYLEEPEYWARAGWGESFKREWKAYYNEEWQVPDSSPDAQYRASKLKYYLYWRTLSQVFDFVKQYGKEHNRTIPCYVPTHSLVNYAHWRIVSPESSLLGVGADGYIAQVWTGTARTPNVYEGHQKQRTFEAALMEYGAMQNLVRASGRRVWYLNDPIEDNPNHDWEDYRTNWENTLTASLLQPEVWRYEIMPWPDRIFNGRHPVRTAGPAFKAPGPPDPAPIKSQNQIPDGTGLNGFARGNPNVERAGIPKPYETELQSVITALGDMKQSDVRWQSSGTRNVGVLISDTMMFQRADPNPSDANLGSFYGLAMPLVKRGVPLDPVQIESAADPGFLDRYKLLLLTYEGQKPPKPEFHEALAKWVRSGGALVVVDDDGDPYDAVREWWNTAPYSYKSPREHLFDALGIPKEAVGLHKVGRGIVLRESDSPAALTYKADGAETVRKLVRQAANAVKLPWKETSTLLLRRGPYLIAAGLDESVPDAKPYVLHGRYLNLFEPSLAVHDDVQISPGSRMLLLDLGSRKASGPKVVAAACRVRNEQTEGQKLRFQVDGIGDTNSIVAITARTAATTVLAGGKPLDPSQYDFAQGVVHVRFPNSVEPQMIEVTFKK
jgi:hypothetical protein